MKNTLFLLALILSGCVCERAEMKVRKGISKNKYLDLLYDRAINDAMNPTPQEIESTLMSLDIARDTLIDDTIYVKMISLVQEDWLPDYRVALRNKSKYAINFDGFYTIVPELKDYFKKEEPYEDAGLQALRVKQILGLPHQRPYSHFVESWIKFSDVKRPCPDSDPKDTSCLLEFPENVDPTYREWFNKTRFATYVAKDSNSYAYPFTQLGYTYDWGGLKNEKGLSEFIVLGKESTKKAYVAQIQTISEYLSN